jgi:hypothetical protein
MATYTVTRVLSCAGDRAPHVPGDGRRSYRLLVDCSAASAVPVAFFSGCAANTHVELQTQTGMQWHVKQATLGAACFSRAAFHPLHCFALLPGGAPLPSGSGARLAVPIWYRCYHRYCECTSRVIGSPSTFPSLGRGRLTLRTGGRSHGAGGCASTVCPSTVPRLHSMRHSL